MYQRLWTRGALLLFTLCCVLTAAPSAFTADKSDDKKDDKEKKEKPKEPPFKYSAWCAFRDLYSQGQVYKLEANANVPQETKEHSRPGSGQWVGYGRRGQWSTLVLEVMNTTEDSIYKGTASIRLDPVMENEAQVTPYRTNYHQDFEVGPGTSKQYRFSVMCPEGWTLPSQTVPIEIVANGRPFFRQVTLQNLDVIGDFIVVVSESAGAFRYLMPSRKNTEDLPDDKGAHREVAVVDPQELPTRWHDLTIASLIIIDGPPREKLSDAQWDALKSYVQAGGSLLITAGKDPSRLKGPLEDLAGITIREMTEVSELEQISPSYKPVRADWRLPVVEVQIRDDSRRNSIIKRNKLGVVEMSQRFYGAGSVTFLPFSLNDPQLEHWSGRTKIPEKILTRGGIGTLFVRRPLEEGTAGVKQSAWNYWNTPAAQVDHAALSQLRNDLDGSLEHDTPVQTQRTATVLSFLLLYLLCAVPGNYFLFGWFRRREIAWLAVPVWGASFSIIAYMVGYMGQTGKLTVNELSVVEAGPHEDVGMARTFFGIYAPRRDDYEIQFPPTRRPGMKEAFDVQAAPGHLINAGNENIRVEMPQLSLLDTETGLTIEKLLIQQRSTRRLEVVHRMNLGDGIDVKVQHNAADETGYDIEIANNSGYDLNYPVYIHHTRAVELGPQPQPEMLYAGKSNKLLAIGTPDGQPWRNKAETFFDKRVTFRTVRGKQAADRTKDLCSFMRDRVDNFRDGVVCAWIETAALPAKIYNSSHVPMELGDAQGLTLVVIPVSIKHSVELTEAARKTPVGVKYALNYAAGSTATGYGASVATMGQLQWQTPANHVVPLQLTQNNQLATTMQRNPRTAVATSASSVLVQIKLPENYADLHFDGCHLQLGFKLVNPNMRTPNAKPTTINANMTVAIETRDQNNMCNWQETDTPIVTQVPFTVGPIDITLGDPKIVNDNCIYVHIISDVPIKMTDDGLREPTSVFELHNFEAKIVGEE